MGLLALLLVANPALDAAEAALADFDPKSALAALKDARAAGPLSLEEHIRFFANAGIAHAYLEHKQESLAAFDALLLLDSGYAIPYTLSPQVTFLFQEARRRAGMPPAVDLSWPRDRRVGQTLPVVVEVLEDPRGMFTAAELHWRRGREGQFTSERLELPGVGEYSTVSLPTDELDANSDLTVQLYLSLFDADGNEVSRLGAPGQPREVTLSYAPPTPWYGKWWVWAIAGTVLAAGTATGVYFATRPEPESVDFGFEARRP